MRTIIMRERRGRSQAGHGLHNVIFKGVPNMKKTAIALMVVLSIIVSAGVVHGAGTLAGTNISNKATAHYTVGANAFSADSNVNTVKVAELIGLTLTWQDAAPGVTVSQGQTNRVTTYKLTNIGNGTETFGLTKADAGVTGDNFDPTVTAVYLDANANGAYDAGTDMLYVAGTNDPTLGPDVSTTIFLLSSIPGSGLVDGDKGNVQVTAASKTGTGIAGTVFAGMGDGGADAVIGSSRGTQTATGTYVVASVVVAVNKTAAVTDQFGGTEPVPGATIRYTITVTVTGAGTAVNMTITDPMPANTTYTAGTLKLGGVTLTDGADGDAGDVGGTTAGALTVGLGNLTSASGAKVITFDVKIN